MNDIEILSVWEQFEEGDLVEICTHEHDARHRTGERGRIDARSASRFRDHNGLQGHPQANYTFHVTFEDGGSEWFWYSEIGLLER